MNSIKFIALLRDWVLIAIGIFIAAHIVDGITYDSQTTLLVVVLLLSIFNIFLKPILVLITLPFIILSFGLVLWFINALLFMLAGALVDGFHVESFGSALFGSLIVSLVTIMANILFGNDKRNPPPPPPQEPHRKNDKDDVIDI